jgi:hypothetical protein
LELAGDGAFGFDVFAAEEVFEFLLELADVFEVAVDAGETDVGYGVYVFEARHDELAEGGGGSFALGTIDDEGFGGVDDFLHLGYGDFALLAGVEKAGENFLAVEFLAAAVFFHDHIRDFVEAFVGGEAFIATFTFAAAPYGVGVLAFTAIDNLVLSKGAKRTFHVTQILAVIDVLFYGVTATFGDEWASTLA